MKVWILPVEAKVLVKFGARMSAVCVAVAGEPLSALSESDSEKVSASTPSTAPVRVAGAFSVRASSSLVILAAAPVSL